MATVSANFLTPQDAAEQLAVGVEKVLRWIHSGELRAVNIAQSRNGERPRWRIPREAWDEFLAGRASAPAPKPIRRRRRDAGEVEDFFP